MKSPPNKPDTFEIELVHSDDGIKKYTAVANKDRERSFCVVIGGEIYQCSGFTPKVKGLWNKSAKIHGPFTREKADHLVTVLKAHR
jgi:hypothetical protein